MPLKPARPRTGDHDHFPESIGELPAANHPRKGTIPMMKTDVEMTKWANENPEEFDRYFKSLPIEPKITYSATPFSGASGKLEFVFKETDEEVVFSFAEHKGPGKVELRMGLYFAGTLMQCMLQQTYWLTHKPKAGD